MTSEPRTESVQASVESPVRSLTTWKIIVLIVGALTPLSIVAGSLPLGMAFGGPSMTWGILIAAFVVGLFCIGYTQMVRRISRPGAFYNYIARGLGRPVGVGAAMIAVVGYTLFLIATFAVQAFLTRTSIQALFGTTVPWQPILIVQLAVVGLLAYRRIDLSAFVIAAVVVVELAAILALVGGIVANKGLGAFPLAALHPHVFAIGQWTVAFVFAFLCFGGYESGALYAPETKRPEKSVPRALYGALALLTVVLVLATWSLTSVSGIDQQQQSVQEAGITGFIYGAVDTYLHGSGLWMFSLVLIFSLMACALSATNFIARYLYSLAAEDILPRVLSKQNRHGSPAAAVLALIGVTLVVVLGLDLLHVDPYAQVSSVAFGLGTLGSTALQALASIAVVFYFRRQPASHRHWWKTSLAPIISSLLLVAALVVELASFKWITGSEEAWVGILPWFVPLALLLGIAFAFWLKKNRPGTYADLAAGDSAEEAAARRAKRIYSEPGQGGQ